jgi:hypothetical protein
VIEVFWLLLALACVGWYLVVLVYVAVRGAADIRALLGRMGGTAGADGKENDG